MRQRRNDSTYVCRGVALNVFNIVNWGPPNGVMESPLFGETQSLASRTVFGADAGQPHDHVYDAVFLLGVVRVGFSTVQHHAKSQFLTSVPLN